jgi:hypothetical protein
MPHYESSCDQCGAYHTYYARVVDCLTTPECCGLKTVKRIFSAPAGVMDIPAYESPASGKWITSRAERREDFKRTNTREWEGMANERQESERKKQYEEVKEDQSLEKTVRQAWANLSPSKKAQALAGG